MFYLPAILIGRLVRKLVRVVRPGGGSALPGLVLSKIAPGLLAKTLNHFKDGLVIVTGSAGKSTTTKMLVAIARAHGKEVFTNPSTANIEQGFFSSIIQSSDAFGNLSGDVAILEMDEGHAAEITKRISPSQVTILNVLEDQLDRFIDPAVVRQKLLDVAQRCSGALVLNADDQNVLLINKEVASTKTTWFGLDSALIAASKHGLGNAPTYQSQLPRPQVSTEIDYLNGKQASGRVGNQSVKFALPNRGLHFALDAAAALESARRYLGDQFDAQLAAKTLDELPPVFARGEIAKVNGEDVEFILVQNPKGGGISGEFSSSGATQMFGVQKTGDLVEQLTWGFSIAILVLVLVTNFTLSDTKDTSTSVNVEKAATKTVPVAPAPAAPKQ